MLSAHYFEASAEGDKKRAVSPLALQQCLLHSRAAGIGLHYFQVSI